MREDTIKLLKECNSGIKMGVSSIDNVLPYVKNPQLKSALNVCKDKHAILGNKTHRALASNNESTTAPHAVAKVMADIKVRAVVATTRSDYKIADVMTDGCNMGIKSLYKYLNKYKDADEESKGIASDIISLEQELRTDLRKYL